MPRSPRHQTHNRHRADHGRPRWVPEPEAVEPCSVCGKPADYQVTFDYETITYYCETCALTYDDGILNGQ